MKLFLSYLKKYRWKAIFAAFLRLIEAVIELLNPLLVSTPKTIVPFFCQLSSSKQMHQ